MSSVIGGALAIVLGGAWMCGGIVGVVYWALEDEVVNALLSVFIPMYGAVSVLMDVAL